MSGELGEGPERDAGEWRRAVVYFETAPKGAFEDREAGRARMDQRNESFVPHLLAVTVGTTVDFPNNDRTYHNVFSLSKGPVRSRALRRRPLEGRALRSPGVVRVFCDIHSHMNAFIRSSTIVSSTSRIPTAYWIDGVPLARTLVAWIEAPSATRRASPSARISAPSKPTSH